MRQIASTLEFAKTDITMALNVIPEMSRTWRMIVLSDMQFYLSSGGKRKRCETDQEGTHTVDSSSCPTFLVDCFTENYSELGVRSAVTPDVPSPLRAYSKIVSHVISSDDDEEDKPDSQKEGSNARIKLQSLISDLKIELEEIAASTNGPPKCDIDAMQDGLQAAQRWAGNGAEFGSIKESDESHFAAYIIARILRVMWKTLLGHWQFKPVCIEIDCSEHRDKPYQSPTCLPPQAKRAKSVPTREAFDAIQAGDIGRFRELVRRDGVSLIRETMLLHRRSFTKHVYKDTSIC